MKLALVLGVSFVLGCSAESRAPEAPGPVASAAPETRTDRGWAKAATGCGDFEVVVSHASKRKFLELHGKRLALGLTKVGDEKTVTLPGATGLELWVAQFPAPGGDETYCTDVVSGTAPKPTANLSATAGSVKVKLTALTNEHDFTLELTLQGVTVKTTDGGTEIVPDATYTDVRVGWLPG